MSQKKSLRILRHGEQGNSLVELAITAPFLLFLLTGIVDFGNAINEYMVITEAVHQGARMASGVSQFRDNSTFVGLTPEGNAGCSSVTARTPAIRNDADYHEQVQNRVVQIINLNTSYIKPGSLCIRSSLEAGTTNGERNVSVHISARLSTFLLGHWGIPIQVQAKAPFLQG